MRVGMSVYYFSLSVLELFSKAFNLLQEFFVVTLFLLHVLFGLGCNERGSLGKPQGTKSLFVIR